jgi:hypothetical protein
VTEDGGHAAEIEGGVLEASTDQWRATVRSDIVPGGVFPDYLLPDHTAATRESRPDWDLAAPGLREAWRTGDLSSFHGWDRRTPDEIRVALGR